MKVRVLGDIEALDEDIRTRILELEEATKDNGGLNFQIALNYGSRDEMIRAVRRLARDCADGKVVPETIDETVFESYLDTHGIPDPDLLIRTSGELRLSNYLLWQLGQLCRQPCVNMVRRSPGPSTMESPVTPLRLILMPLSILCF